MSRLEELGAPPQPDMNRRKYPRLIGPFKGQWQSVTGMTTQCQIADISPGGCFVRSRTTPGRRMPVTIVVTFEDGTAYSVRGYSIHGEWSNGFGVSFQAMTSEQRAEFGRLLDRLAHLRKSA